LSRLVINQEKEIAKNITIFFQRTFSVKYKKVIQKIATAFPSSDYDNEHPEDLKISDMIKS
jgi:hypothetical protein